ncbi:MAG: DMT family transporter [Acidimicrobiales bacterium]
MTRRGWFFFIAVGILWGLPYLLIKVSVRELSPAVLVLVRTGGASLVVVPLAAARGALRPALRHWRPLVAYTAVEIAVPWGLVTTAERRLPSSLTGLLIGAVPLVAALLAWATGTDRVDLRRLAGLLVGLGGVGLLVGFDVGDSQVLAVASLGVVVVGYACGPWIVSRHLGDVPPIGILAFSVVCCAVVYAPFAAISLPTRPLSASVIESAAALTVVCTVTAFLCFFALIREVGAMRATLVTYVNPAVAVVLGVTVLGEPFGLATAAGFVLVLGGCALAARPLARRRPLEGDDHGVVPEAPSSDPHTPGSGAVPMP